MQNASKEMPQRFAEIVLRVAVPIVQSDSVSRLWEWRRVCNVTTLGELLLYLGHRHAAKQIYYFYRTLRIIAVKRQKYPRTAGPALAPPLTRRPRRSKTPSFRNASALS